jgi:molecular chaperone GrpE (heat shock protein)
MKCLELYEIIDQITQIPNCVKTCDDALNYIQELQCSLTQSETIYRTLNEVLEREYKEIYDSIWKNFNDEIMEVADKIENAFLKHQSTQVIFDD